MAIEVCSEISSPGFSPRISFSHDLDKANATVPKEEQQQQRLDSSLVDSSSDFDFCIVNNIKLELSSADELFSNGKILPVQIKPKPNTNTTSSKEILFHPPQSATKNTEKKRLKEFLDDSNTEDEATENEEKPPIAKPSWQFRRSSSLNLDSTTTARGMNLIRSLHFLSRSNSTGSAPNPKQTVTPNQKQQHLRKNQSTNSRRRSSSASSSSCSSSTTYYPYNTSPRSHKPSLRRSGSYGNGVRISPVLNLPPPYISKVTVSLFGFGSLFCNVLGHKNRLAERKSIKSIINGKSPFL
ncbi:hypothetical protein ACLB2K_039401 [Fragaria x ananassa]